MRLAVDGAMVTKAGAAAWVNGAPAGRVQVWPDQSEGKITTVLTGATKLGYMQFG
jgi:hypothetical protein